MFEKYDNYVSLFDIQYGNILNEDTVDTQVSSETVATTNDTSKNSNNSTIIIVGIVAAVIIVALIFRWLTTNPMNLKHSQIKYFKIYDKYGYESKECEEYLRKRAKKSEGERVTYENYMKNKRAGKLENIPDSAVWNYDDGHHTENS